MHEIKRLIAAERRACTRYTFLLLFSLRASRAERERWRGLRSYHEGQLAKWRNTLFNECKNLFGAR